MAINIIVQVYCNSGFLPDAMLLAPWDDHWETHLIPCSSCPVIMPMSGFKADEIAWYGSNPV